METPPRGLSPLGNPARGLRPLGTPATRLLHDVISGPYDGYDVMPNTFIIHLHDVISATGLLREPDPGTVFLNIPTNVERIPRA